MSAFEFEGHEALIAALREGTLDAPDHLHRRVLAGGSVKRRRWSDMSGRKRVFAVVAIAATLAVGAALVHAALSNPNSRQALGLSLRPETHGSALIQRGPNGPPGATGASGTTGANGPTGMAGPAGAHGPAARYGPTYGLNQESAALSGAKQAPIQRSAAGSPALYIPKNRLVHATAYLSVVVPNHNALTTATNKATGIVTHLGGYAQSVRYSASNRGYGSAYLALHVPLGKTEEAIASLGALGRLVSQTISTQDLERQFTTQTNTISKLSREIAVYEQALASGTLSGQQRLNVQLKLANARHELEGTRTARAHTVKAGSNSSIYLNLTTKRHAAVVAGPHKRGRLSQMLHNAVGFLAVEAFVVFYVIIVALPLILLAGLIWWLTRGRRQRDEKRLLASA
jgi:hypothetical protein